MANSDVATKEYVDAQSGGGVCYTNYGSSTCATGFTPVLVGYTTLYIGFTHNDTAGWAAGGASLACSSITHDSVGLPVDAYGSSRSGYGTYLNNERCVICCK